MHSQLREYLSKLIEYIAATYPQGNLSEEAGDLKAISALINKSELAEGEEQLLVYLFTKYELTFSREPLDLIQLVLSIIEPNASPYSEVRRLSSSVTQIKAKASVNVKIIKGDKPSIKIVTNGKKNASKIITREEGDTLVIDQEPTVIMSKNGSVTSIIHGRVGQVFSGGVMFGGSMNINMNGDSMLINSQNVSEMRDSEYVEITTRTIESIQISGSSNISYKDISQTGLSVKISGSGSVALSGAVDYLRGKVSGSGDITAKELIAKNAELKVSGSGDIRANVTNHAEVEVSGSGDIKVIGKPTTKSKRCTGSGSIKFE